MRLMCRGDQGRDVPRLPRLLHSQHCASPGPAFGHHSPRGRRGGHGVGPIITPIISLVTAVTLIPYCLQLIEEPPKTLQDKVRFTLKTFGPLASPQLATTISTSTHHYTNAPSRTTLLQHATRTRHRPRLPRAGHRPVVRRRQEAPCQVQQDGYKPRTHFLRSFGRFTYSPAHLLWACCRLRHPLQ